MADTQINEKGAREYIRAARILTDSPSGTGPVMGPIIQCQGQAVEIALKLCIEKRGRENPKHHDLVRLHREDCPDVNLSEQQFADLTQLNANYCRDGDLQYPSRYRSSEMRVYSSPGQEAIEALLEAILSQQERP